MKFIKTFESYIIGEIDNNGKIHKDSTMNGYVYKNAYEFENKSDEICYIPEYGDEDNPREDGFTYQDFLDIAKEAIKNYDWNITPEQLAQNLFDDVDWQSPHTLIDDWANSDVYDE
jgi:hypothetical protein